MAKANYVTVGRKPKNGKTPKVQEAFRLPKEMVDRINELVNSGRFSKKIDVAEKAFEFYFAHLDKEERK